MMRIFLLVMLALSMSSAWAHSEGKDQRTLERRTRQLTREAERLARQSERYAARRMSLPEDGNVGRNVWQSGVRNTPGFAAW